MDYYVLTRINSVGEFYELHLYPLSADTKEKRNHNLMIANKCNENVKQA
jgi:hypothetical protein